MTSAITLAAAAFLVATLPSIAAAQDPAERASSGNQVQAATTASPEPKKAPAAAPSTSTAKATESAPAARQRPAPADVPNSQVACRRILIGPNLADMIESNIDVATRIEFPAAVVAYTVSLPTLWDVKYSDNDVWVRPKSSDSEAQTTGLTVELDDGRKFDFRLRAIEQLPPSCVVVHATQAPIVKSSPANPARDQSLIAGNLLAEQRRQFDEQLRQLTEQVTVQAMDKIKAFQEQVFTRYDWNGKVTADTEILSAVYDDGRMTYIRVTTSAYGLPSVSGKLGDDDVVLPIQYNDLTGVFTINGLYDQLRVRLGSHEILIKRQG